MVTAKELERSKNKVLDLVFKDGHAVRAKLLTVDIHAPEEIIYDILEVLTPGPLDPAIIKPGTVAAGDPAHLASYRIVD